MKSEHEIRDPIHVFIRLSTDERKILDSRPFQRLRKIHQLALTYLVYPSATHRRFEHSLGVMELATRVFNVITDYNNITDAIRETLPQLDNRDYWRKVLRAASLCHDIGHLPFSHAAEKELLPDGWDHERLTVEIIKCDEMREIWKDLKLDPDDIAKLAVGQKKLPEKVNFTDWETILSEIIVGDSFGVDRMDYLLRDAYHLGVSYGKFDHYRLIDILRILPLVPTGSHVEERSNEPHLGVEEGGLQSAEALLFARYCMFTQVYLHRIRRIYDIHLKDFLVFWLPEGKFSTNINDLLNISDNDVLVALEQSMLDENSESFIHFRRILNREHFKVIYQRNQKDIKKNPGAVELVYNETCKRFSGNVVRKDRYTQKGSEVDFPVLLNDGRIVSSSNESQVLEHIPLVAFDYVYVDRELEKEAREWLNRNREDIIMPEREEDT